jgi:hypothetical protein
MLPRKWIVTVGIQDDMGEWWERRFEAEAPDVRAAFAAGAEKARESNPYARDVRPYRAELVPTASRRLSAS